MKARGIDYKHRDSRGHQQTTVGDRARPSQSIRSDRRRRPRLADLVRRIRKGRICGEIRHEFFQEPIGILPDEREIRTRGPRTRQQLAGLLCERTRRTICTFGHTEGRQFGTLSI